MRRNARRRSTAYLCLAVVLLAVLLPGMTIETWTVPEPGWILLPDLARRERPVSVATLPPVDQPTTAPRDGRAPPSFSAPLV